MFRTVASTAIVVAVAFMVGTSTPLLAAADEGSAKAAAAEAATTRLTLYGGWTRLPDSPAARRPKALPFLYVSLAVLEATDLYTTHAGLKDGAVEANPVFARAAGNSTASIALKAAGTAGTIAFTERLWKKNRAAAVAVMIGVNGATAAIAARNVKVARAPR